MKKQLGIGLYGDNGHQVHELVKNNEHVRIVAVSAVGSRLSDYIRSIQADVSIYDSLEAMLEDPQIDLISLCSPMRSMQARHALQCLKAGKHVYAEKPCAMNEEELDLLVWTANDSGLHFHEMAGTAFAQPYLSMRQLVLNGTIGEVVQVFAQKSYPYHEGRPQDEDEDGGLIMQNGIHALRFIEHVACKKIETITAVETGLGNPAVGNLQMAASYLMTLEGGAIASVIANYLNPKGMGRWGNEHLRIFGTAGFMESTNGGTATRLVVGDTDFGEIAVSEASKCYFEMVIDAILYGTPLPISLEEELHPTRCVIRAKQSATEISASV